MSDGSAKASRAPLRLLCLDGGGILGAFSAGVLAGLMDRANQDKELAGQPKTGFRLIDHVDLIAGTSTGGILAIALAMGRHPVEVCDF